MTRLEEIMREIEEKQEEISDLVKELKDFPDDKPAVRPIAVYLNEEEIDAISAGIYRYKKNNNLKTYSRSAFMRKILLDYCEEI